METAEEKALKDRIDALEQLVLEKDEKEPGAIKRALGVLNQSVGNALMNIVQDPASTIAGASVAVGVVYAHWPNIDGNVIMEAVGFSTMGGISNNHKTPATAIGAEPERG